MRRIITLHAWLTFAVGLLLFLSKWFPYGTPMIRMREWLYKFF